MNFRQFVKVASHVESSLKLWPDIGIGAAMFRKLQFFMNKDWLYLMVIKIEENINPAASDVQLVCYFVTSLSRFLP